MKTWTELQEWVELEGDRAAAVAAKVSLDAAELPRAADLTLREIAPDLTDNEREIVLDAIRAKAAEFLSNHYQDASAGWFESYYLTLKRMHEEES